MISFICKRSYARHSSITVLWDCQYRHLLLLLLMLFSVVVVLLVVVALAFDLPFGTWVVATLTDVFFYLLFVQGHRCICQWQHLFHVLGTQKSESICLCLHVFILELIEWLVTIIIIHGKQCIHSLLNSASHIHLPLIILLPVFLCLLKTISNTMCCLQTLLCICIRISQLSCNKTHQ
jgi:hypothetical protein